jgi:hypothetical protein
MSGKWIHHSASSAGSWRNDAISGRVTPTAGRNAFVAELAAMRDALNAPTVVLNDAGAIAFLPKLKYRGNEAEWQANDAPIVGALPAPDSWECTAAIDATGSFEGQRRATSTAISRCFELLGASGIVSARSGTAPAGDFLLFDGPAFVWGDAADALLPDPGELVVLEDRETAFHCWNVHVSALSMIRRMARSRANPLAAAPSMTDAETLAMESVVELAEQRQAAALRANARAFTTTVGTAIGLGVLLGSEPAKKAAKAAIKSLFR